MRKSISWFVGGVLLTASLSYTLRGEPAAMPSTQPALQPPQQPAGQPAMQMDPAMLQAMQAYATPGVEHAELAKWVGEWTTEMEDLTPGMGNARSAGTATVTMVLGGRYMMEEFRGEMMGQPFEGLSLTGFDNKTRQFFTTWLDSMSTGLAVQHGTMSNNVMNMEGQCTCPIMDKPLTLVSRVDCSKPDTRVMEMTMTSADGQPMGAMRITYVRKK